MTVKPLDETNRALCQTIVHRITAGPQQRISFAEYMDLVLYDPQGGYYTNQALSIGAVGDFFTAAHLGPDFGELLGEQFVQMWQGMGRPIPFTLVEMGAGQGILAADLLKYVRSQHPDFFQALEYKIVEKARVRFREQQQQLP
ncbi:MAG TPA: SAM-dependent methyltransferase, partial [Candidatus Caenarcaniphilales bacterium]